MNKCLFMVTFFCISAGGLLMPCHTRCRFMFRQSGLDLNVKCIERRSYRIFEFWVWLPTRADQPSLAASSSPEPGWPAASSCREEAGGLTSAQHWLSMFEVNLTRTADWYRGLNIAPEMWLAQQYWEFKSVTSDTVKFGWGEIWWEKMLESKYFKDRYYTLFTLYSDPAFCLAPPPAHNGLLLEEVSPRCINTDCWNNLESLRFCPGSFECQERQSKFFKMVSSIFVNDSTSVWACSNSATENILRDF